MFPVFLKPPVRVLGGGFGVWAVGFWSVKDVRGLAPVMA